VSLVRRRGAETPVRRDFCIVTETYAPEINGVAMTLTRLVEGLGRRGHSVAIVRPRRPGLDPRGPRETEVTLVPGAPVPGYRGVRVGWPVARRLRARWTVRRPDAVYVATPGPLGWAAVHAARRLGLPVLSGFHTDFPRYARHYRAGWLARGLGGYLRRLHNQTRATIIWGGFLAVRFPHPDWYVLPVVETLYYALGAHLEAGPAAATRAGDTPKPPAARERPGSCRALRAPWKERSQA
jgi:Glycosyltransferase Family 4